MGKRTSTHEVSLAVRLVGWHEATTERTDSAVQVLIPGAAITLSDRRAVSAVFRAWIEARLVGRKVFNDQGARSYLAVRPQITAAVHFQDWPYEFQPVITGKGPLYSPSGCGQVIVQMRQFTVVCDDRAAWEVQYQVWRHAYELAADLWELYPVHIYEPMIAERIADRLFGDGPG
ncbi:hypothetical protein [Actinomadura sp. WMMA1423]|uniref:hypothetical protein n=1 Tax=Actinomadura sp. WMMA1423 TaxID=2591108 RepID=UPI001146A70F|nr:hypothetical protein [Actinomadura sp. WMMA1423]